MLRLFLFASVLTLFSLNGHSKLAPSPNVQVQVDQINVSVDPRIELISVIKLLSKPYSKSPLVTRFNHDYKQRILKYFVPYKTHAAIVKFDQLVNKGFTFGRPSVAMLHLDQTFTRNKNIVFNQHSLTSKYDQKEVEEFLKLVKVFALDSNFMSFYEQHRALYLSLINKTAQHIAGNSQITLLEDFYGEKKGSYNIILAPIFHDGGFGPSMFTSQGGEHFYSINGPTKMSAKKPDFGEKTRTLHLVNHEFSHSFLRDVFEKNRARIDATAQLLAPIKNPMEKQGYGNWHSVLNEHVVRAITIQLANAQDKKLGQDLLKAEKQKSYLYIDTVLQHVEQYQQQKSKFGNFNNYFNHLLITMEQLANKSASIVEI